MPDPPTLKPREVVAALERAGFYRIRQRGSHLQLKKGHLLAIPRRSPATAPYRSPELVEPRAG
ncbi:MAG: type II toxin-antitoxin system HicA family toxin [Chloroflexi bacterium]|nr:type II toxin-antitoxin system HicA family toxin [Chloroflexota bacterium]